MDWLAREKVGRGREGEGRGKGRGRERAGAGKGRETTGEGAGAGKAHRSAWNRRKRGGKEKRCEGSRIETDWARRSRVWSRVEQ